MKINEKVFREYDIRGVAERDLPDEFVETLGLAIGTFLRERKGKTFALGRDCRVSSPRIHKALLKGLLGCGLEVIDVGLVPTPLLYFATRELKVDGGLMITGSHNPPEHNGFKIVMGASTIHGEDIQVLKDMVLKGKFATGEKGTVRSENIIPRYIEMVVKNIRTPLKLNVVVDSGNGMAGIVAPELFRRLGCTVTEMYSELDGRFPNHHPDPTLPESLLALTSKVKEVGAIVGIGFDGDADRIGAVDPTGVPIYGDELLVLYSREILTQKPGAKIISEVKASHRLFQDIAKHGGVPILWKTGHSLIKAKMKEEGALLAGEMSGHMFFNDRYYGYDDAIYAAARLFEILEKHKKTPCALLADLPKSYCTPELRIDCPDDIKFDVVADALQIFRSRGFKVNSIDGARIEFDDGWGLVRASNTQPVLVYRFEATTPERLNEIRALVENTVRDLLKQV
jgi:phosphomannomutase / phosphoglucomutase